MEEKMKALKKAYAEIILNTSKEAAARVMVSERRARKCNYDLDNTKEDAFRLLVRFKQSMEFKINEVEKKSVNQQKRIDELEAQLQEAEDIVTDLRGELNEAHIKLEEMAQNQLRNQSNAMGNAPSDIGHPQVENCLSEAVLDSQANWLSNCAANGHLAVNGHSIAHNYMNEHVYSGELDLPSIIMRSKSSELYRNGCTQRIRACEANILNGQFSLAGGLDNLKTTKAVRQDIEREKICITSIEEKGVDTEEIKVDKGGLKMNAFKSCQKKRKRAARYRRCMPSSIKVVPHVPKKAQPDLSDLKPSLAGSHDMHDSNDNEGKGTQSYVSSTTPSYISEMVALPKLIANVNCDDMLTEPCDVNEDREELSSLVLIKQQNASGDGLDAPGSRTYPKMKNLSSSNLDAYQMETSDGLLGPQPKNRVFKFTFQRKGKKESVVSDTSSLPDKENSLRNEMVKRQNGILETSIPRAVSEAPRDEPGDGTSGS